MDLVFLGSGAFGVPTLARLAESHTITGIVTQPDRRAGRGSKLAPTPVGEWAAANLPDVPVLKPESINETPPRERVRSWSADAWVVIAYGQYLGSKLLEDRFAINLHASLLPRWRGAAPINAAIVAGDRISGNSVITIARRMDAGAVLARSQRPIGPDQTAGVLHDLLAGDGPALVEGVLDAHARGRLIPQTQDETLVTVAPKLSKSDGVVDFHAPARRCAARINGLNPWPGVSVRFRTERLKINQALPKNMAEPPQGLPGTIIDADSGTVLCGDGNAIELLEVQAAGKRAMDWKSFSRGRSVHTGERFATDSSSSV